MANKLKIGFDKSILSKRLAILKELLKNEQASKEPSQTYIDDLRLSIARATKDAKNASADGYRMIG
jgi:uncharacterized protein Smg (DUF494 family)